MRRKEKKLKQWLCICSSMTRYYVCRSQCVILLVAYFIVDMIIFKLLLYLCSPGMSEQCIENQFFWSTKRMALEYFSFFFLKFSACENQWHQPDRFSSQSWSWSEFGYNSDSSIKDVKFRMLCRRRFLVVVGCSWL
jgi:hypothetical protein